MNTKAQLDRATIELEFVNEDLELIENYFRVNNDPKRQQLIHTMRRTLRQARARIRTI